MDRKKISLRHFCGFPRWWSDQRGIQKEDVLEELLDQFDSFLCDFLSRTKVTVMINEQLPSCRRLLITSKTINKNNWRTSTNWTVSDLIQSSGIKININQSDFYDFMGGQIKSIFDEIWFFTLSKIHFWRIMKNFLVSDMRREKGRRPGASTVKRFRL